jgi:hypothetical protein
LPADGWGAPQPMSRRRRTAIKLIGIVVVFAVAVAAVNIVWDLLRHDATEVPSAANVALGPAGLPEGYEWAGEYQQGGDRLICGPVTWELVGDYPVGGRNAVEEAVELASQMTGVAINPVEEVAVPAVEITFEYVSSAELESHTTGSGDHAIGLAITQHTTFGITESEVLLDREFFDNALSSNPDQAVLTVLHEIGHAFGLGHSDLDQSLMYPYISARTRIFEEDVAAFAAVAPDCG